MMQIQCAGLYKNGQRILHGAEAAGHKIHYSSPFLYLVTRLLIRS